VTGHQQISLAEQFEPHRSHLRAVAYRMLGSLHEADDAVQEAWLRFNDRGGDGIDNLGGWLTTVVGRICLDLLRARKARPQEPLDVHLPDPVVSPESAAGTAVAGADVAAGAGDGIDPEHEALLADSVGLALLVVMDALSPAERLAFVLHDMFAVPFDEIAPIVGRSIDATKKLASRARRRVDGADVPVPDTDITRQREVVDAFFAAARNGDFAALVSVLDPDVVLITDGGALRPDATMVVRGAESAARRAMTFAGPAAFAQPAVVNGIAGAVVAPQGRPFSIMAFTVRGEKIVAIHVLMDPERLGQLDLTRFAS
jgi:RNA polymerase sigma factor (sigma-70 family)